MMLPTLCVLVLSVSFPLGLIWFIRTRQRIKHEWTLKYLPIDQHYRSMADSYPNISSQIWIKSLWTRQFILLVHLWLPQDALTLWRFTAVWALTVMAVWWKGAMFTTGLGYLRAYLAERGQWSKIHKWSAPLLSLPPALILLSLVPCEKREGKRRLPWWWLHPTLSLSLLTSLFHAWVREIL